MSAVRGTIGGALVSTPEQEAVIEAFRDRYDQIIMIGEVPATIEITVEYHGDVNRYLIEPDGSTRSARAMGGVPVRLYGGLPSGDKQTEEWAERAKGYGSGLPKYALPFMKEAGDGTSG